jgi:3-oxoacyl-[acyl-carrier protein] reductase
MDVDEYTNTRVLLTGGTSGIGAGILEAYIDAGARVVYSGRSDRAITRKARASGRASFVAADLADSASAGKLFDSAVELLGAVDVLVHCAAIFPEHALVDMPLAEWNEVLGVNLTSGMQLLSRFGAQAKPGGRAVLISSITGPRTVLPGLAHYAASKAGVEGLVRAAAHEFAPSGITVNAVAPGSVLTPALEAGFGTDGLARLTEKIPVGRIGSPADIAAAVLFLTSPAAGFVTGQALVVDGGQTLVELF